MAHYFFATLYVLLASPIGGEKNEKLYRRCIQMTSSAVPRPRARTRARTPRSISSLCEFRTVDDIVKFVADHPFDPHPTLEELDRVITHFEDLELSHLSDAAEIHTIAAKTMVYRLLAKGVQFPRELVARVVVDEFDGIFKEWEHLFYDDDEKFTLSKVFAMYTRLYSDEVTRSEMISEMMIATFADRTLHVDPMVHSYFWRDLSHFPDVANARAEVVRVAQSVRAARANTPDDRAACDYAQIINARRAYEVAYMHGVQRMRTSARMWTVGDF
jgi:hypothetical protein